MQRCEDSIFKGGGSYFYHPGIMITGFASIRPKNHVTSLLDGRLISILWY